MPDDDEHHRCQGVGHRREHVPHPIEPLEVVLEEDRQEADEEHAHARTEVAGVDARQQDAGSQSPPAARTVAMPSKESRKSGLHDHQRDREQDQQRHDSMEDSFWQGQEEDGTAHGSDRRRNRQLDRAGALAGELAPVANHPADVAQDQADRVAHIRHDRRVPHGKQSGKGQEGARADHGVDHSRRQAGGQDREDVQEAQADRG